MNDKDNNRNSMFALLACMVLLFGYQIFILGPQQKKAETARAAAAASASSSSVAAVAAGIPSGTLTPDQARANSPRVPIDTPSLKGSIALKGGLLDDLYLAKYRDTIDAGSPLVELLRPAGADHAYYEQSGFKGQNIQGLPDNNTVWQLVSGNTLRVGQPVVLGYDSPSGLQFRRTLSVDENYMITVADTVTNTGAQPVALTPYAYVTRIDMPTIVSRSAYVHEGSLATFKNPSPPPFAGPYETLSTKYKDLADDAKKGKKARNQGTSTGGWFAITDKYFMVAVIPDQKASINYVVGASQINAKPVFQAGYDQAQVTIAPGQSWTGQARVFAGAKQDAMMRAYEKALGIPRFENALDWGNLGFITYPFFIVLTWLYGLVKNYGLAILCLTVIIRAAFYPLAHRAQVQSVKMKHVMQRLQPKLDAIKKRYPDDQQKQQEAQMQLYQEEKFNPMASMSGCLPLLLTLPVFFCLAKVLQMDIGLRHAPFFGWINDLSAPDPLTIVNLFGLLPFNPATVPVIGGFLNGPLHIGPVAILYGASMWASQQMTPMTGIDPTQKRMMAFMPLMMVFFFSQLPIGLMVYYLWSNILTMAQSYVIMKQLKVENPIDELIAKIRGKGEKKAA